MLKIAIFIRMYLKKIVKYSSLETRKIFFLLLRFERKIQNKMEKVFIAKRRMGSFQNNVLGRKRYDIDRISRTQINLPPNHSALSITKYFEDCGKGHEYKK